MGIVVDCVMLLTLVAVGYGQGTNSSNTTSSNDGIQFTYWRSVEPSSGVAVGEVARLQCFLEYKNQTKSPFTKFYMLVGINEIYDATSEDELIDAESNLCRRTITANRTIQASDKGQDFRCRLISTTMNFSSATKLIFRKSASGVEHIIPIGFHILSLLYIGLTLLSGQ